MYDNGNYYAGFHWVAFGIQRQDGTIYNTQYVTYPIAFKTVLCITANASNKTEAVNLYDITMTTVELHNNGGTPNFTKWLAFGM